MTDSESWARTGPNFPQGHMASALGRVPHPHHLGAGCEPTRPPGTCQITLSNQFLRSVEGCLV